MEHKILVCYATGSGSTGEVADFIGKELARDNVAVEVRAASNVTALDDYSAVVVGSSVRFGRWLSDATAFLDEFSAALTARPVAFFMTCLTLMEDSEKAWETALAYWDPVRQLVPDIEPVGLGLFAGSLAPQLGQLPEYQHRALVDYRDWDAIRAWAHEIRPTLLMGKPRASAPMVLAGTILSYTDLSGYNLSRFDFQDAELVSARLQDANLQHADLRHSKLRDADLQGADLSQAQLGWADLRGAQCQAANFSWSNLIGVHLENADLQEASLTHAILNGANLSHANLQQADLRHADLNWADLQGSDLTGTNLAKANLGWANLRDVKLAEANLNGTRYNTQTKWPHNFSPQQAGAILTANQPG